MHLTATPHRGDSECLPVYLTQPLLPQQATTTAKKKHKKNKPERSSIAQKKLCKIETLDDDCVCACSSQFTNR